MSRSTFIYAMGLAPQLCFSQDSSLAIDVGRLSAGKSRLQRTSNAAPRWHFWRREQGQSLIEVALMMPIFTILVCYAVDLGYFFLVAASLSSAVRNGMEYAVQGTSSPSQIAQPSAAVVSTVTIGSIGLSDATTSTVSVQVCSRSVGVNISTNTARCANPSTGAGAIAGTPDTDPESPTFQLNRVDVVYTVTPPIPMPVAIFPTRQFHRMIEMRSIQ